MIKKIAVIGTGVIGTGWIIRFLDHDKKVIAYDKNLNSDKKIIAEIKRTWPYVKKLFNKKRLKLKNFSFTTSLKESLKPGTFVIVDQFIDRTTFRKKSFFSEGIIAHVPMANPTSVELMNASKNILDNLNIKNVLGGTYLAMEGPQFSTMAESNIYRTWNCDVIGMTNMPEAKLSREAEIRYCSISMVTDYDCWHQDHESVNLEMILNTMRKNTEKSKKFIQSISNEYYKGIDFSEDKTRNILDTSIVTHRDSWDKEIEIKLTTILKRYKEVNS